MCGICGFNFEDKLQLKKMCDSIAHRGPDDVGYFTDSKVSIGMRRLSIIDLQTGHQPQHNEEEDIWIVFNGEIYNFLELRSILENKGHNFYTNSDTEVVIHAYEEWGRELLKKLDGPFAFCIYDLRKQILFLARDQLGIKPLYYYFNGKRFIFGSEIKCILLHGINRTLNKKAFNFFISLKYIPSNLTLFEGIYKIPSSSYLILDLKNENISIEKYYNINFDINWDKNEDQLAKELSILVEESIKKRLISEVPLGAFLSGGLDSSAVVGIMSKYMDEPVKTFSIGFEEGAPINETIYSRYVADYYGTDHNEYIIKSSCYELIPKLIWHLDDLISDAAIIPIYFLAEHAKSNVTVALTGDGADEVFAGYSKYFWYFKRNAAGIMPVDYSNYQWFFMKDIISVVPTQLFKIMIKFLNLIPSDKLQIILSYLNLSKTEEDRLLRGYLHVRDIEKTKILSFKAEKVEPILKKMIINNLDVINQMINYDLNYQLPNQYNMKADKMSMAASLELRVPFLDRNIVNWAATIPPELKLKGITEKYILRLALKDILPSQILKRKKLGFSTPINFWLKRGMREISGEILERLEKRNMIIKPNYIKKVKKNRSHPLYENRAWTLIMFEIWYETFMENSGEKPIFF